MVNKQVYNFLRNFLFYPVTILVSDQVNRPVELSCISSTMLSAYPCLDSKPSVISIFGDFSKAFDSVDHSILLEYYCIRDFVKGWVKSILSGRTQHGSNSGDLPLSHGVPQGSVLDPLLFLIFINDLPNSTNKLKFTLFVDDSTLSYIFNLENPVAASNQLNAELSKVHDWLLLNKIKLISKNEVYCILLQTWSRPWKNCNGAGEILGEDWVEFLAGPCW